MTWPRCGTGPATSAGGRPELHRPRSEDELVAAVRASDRPIRVLGAGHSFTPLAATDQVTLQLDGLAGLVSVDRQRQQATIGGGTRLRDLGPLLAAQGLALENQGDVDAQSLGGVLATATHGTGSRLGCVASRALAVQLVLASGDTLTLERERDGGRFLAAAVSLGCLGVVTRGADAAATRLPPARGPPHDAPGGLPGRSPAPGRRAPPLRVPLVPPHRPGADEVPGHRPARRRDRRAARSAALLADRRGGRQPGVLAGLPGGPAVARSHARR